MASFPYLRIINIPVRYIRICCGNSKPYLGKFLLVCSDLPAGTAAVWALRLMSFAPAGPVLVVTLIGLLVIGAIAWRVFLLKKG